MSNNLGRVILCTGFFLAIQTAQSVFAACSDISRNDLVAAADFVKATPAEQTLTSGLRNHMWVAFLNETGKVCEVVNTAGPGQNSGQTWAISRVIALQKANTSTGLSLDNAATGGIQAWASGALILAAMPVFDPATGLVAATATGLQGSLFGVQFSNPIDANLAYAGNPDNYGRSNDPAKSKRLGGINVFGGGLPIYNAALTKVGAIGVSGDTSCTDHAFAWRVRERLAATLGLASGAQIEAANGGVSQVLNISNNSYPGCGLNPPLTGAVQPNDTGIL